MKHQHINEIGDKAQVVAFKPAPLTRAEKLNRWAEVLDRQPGPISALTGVEYVPPHERMRMRGDRTPITVAFADPVLRDEGLTGDTFGEAKSFFELSDREAHRLLCDCHYRGTMSAELVARRLKAMAKGGLSAWFA